MNNKLIIPFMLCIALCAVAFGQKKEKIVNVSGSASILIDDSHNVGQVRRTVESDAIIDALEKEFGRAIVQGNRASIENIQSGADVSSISRFNSISNSEVKGEWVETTYKEVKWELREVTKGKQELWLLCTIEGKARSLAGADVQFELKTLRCDKVASCETYEYLDGEDFFMEFKTPVNGYMSVFMIDYDDPEGLVARIFPYTKQTGDMESAAPVKADKSYVLFSKSLHSSLFNGASASEVDNIYLTTGGKPQLFNRLFVVFSSKPFSKPVLDIKQEWGGVKVIGIDKFTKWVNSNKGADDTFQTKMVDIVIKKK